MPTNGSRTGKSVLFLKVISPLCLKYKSILSGNQIKSGESDKGYYNRMDRLYLQKYDNIFVHQDCFHILSLELVWQGS